MIGLGNSLLARFGLLVVLAGMLPLTVAQSREVGFEVSSASSELVDGVYLTDVQIGYEFSDYAMEALQNGVPLTIEVLFEVRSPRWWWWDSSIASLSQRFVLQYHALSQQYLVSNLNTGVQSSFYSRYAAVLALGRISRLPILDAKLLAPDDEYEIRVRASLDIEALPSPLRPWAYFSSDWRLKSDWHSWRLK